MPLDLHFNLFVFLIVMAVELGIGLLIDAQSWTVGQIKQIWGLGVISGIGTMGVMVARANRTSVD